MRKIQKLIVAAAAVVLLIAACLVAMKTAKAAPASSKYIEVCRGGTVYVPRETRYVTCQGKVMKVVAIIPLEEGQEALLAGDCNCPKCCGGFCTVVVSCQPEPETSPGGHGSPDVQKTSASEAAAAGGGLCYLYLACGD